MAIRDDGVTVVTVGDLLNEPLRIPPYQRPYSWEPATALQLLNDIRDAFRDEHRSETHYVLGAVILHQESSDQSALNVVDGQQRLLTLKMILSILGLDGSGVNPTNSENPLTAAFNALRHRLGAWPSDVRASLRTFITDRCQMVRVVTNDVDEAFRVFDSQNYRGKALAPHDLLKAHHLREMRGDSDAMMAAVVEAWESVSDSDLDRLFSTFLYRIARWSRGEPAPGFTTKDIGMFKGIPHPESRTPHARYHLAAQAAVPMFSAWASTLPDAATRDLSRTRFQLDAPVPSGRAFFEMVTFMLAELTTLRADAFPEDWADFASYDPGKHAADSEIFTENPSRSRYRYVSELYLAALLYYTNKFGDEDLEAARQRLFAWAFTPRVEYLRVQFRTVDKKAQDGANSAFAMLRNATGGGSVYELASSSRPYRQGHEVKLGTLLNGLGARA